MTRMDQDNPSKPTDFSIDHILNRAGSSTRSDVLEEQLSWIQCTRYCPPKVPRSQRREGPQKRQLGRHPRIPFTSHQLTILEEKFQQSPYLSSEEVISLSKRLQLADIRVKIWFQNRRARERRERAVPINDSTSQQNVIDEGPINQESTNFCVLGQNMCYLGPLPRFSPPQ